MYNLLNDLKESRKTYSEMIEFCCDNLILNNYLIEELSRKGLYFEIESGEEGYEEEGEYYYYDIYQYYIISSHDADRLARYTNELVMYNEETDIYLLCVTHFGTCWVGVPSNWKQTNEDN